MTDRLEKAIRELSSTDMEQITKYAEFLASNATSGQKSAGEPMQLQWAGALKDGPYSTGVEAQDAARHYRGFLLERSMQR